MPADPLTDDEARVLGLIYRGKRLDDAEFRLASRMECDGFLVFYGMTLTRAGALALEAWEKGEK